LRATLGSVTNQKSHSVKFAYGFEATNALLQIEWEFNALVKEMVSRSSNGNEGAKVKCPKSKQQVQRHDII